MSIRNIIEASLYDYDPRSQLYHLKPDGAEKSGSGFIKARSFDCLQGNFGSRSLNTHGFSSVGTKFVVDITDKEDPIILYRKSDPGKAKGTLGLCAVPRDLEGITTISFNKKLGGLLNSGFKGVGDCMFVGPHNNGSMSCWGSSYGHTLAHAFIKSSDNASFETFFLDDVARIKGSTLQSWTSLGERNIEASGNTSTEAIEESHFIHETLGRNREEDKFEINSGFALSESDKEKSVLKITESDYNLAVENSFREGEDGVDARETLEKVRQRYEQFQQDHPRILPRRVKLNGYLGHGDLDLVTKSTSYPKELPNQYLPEHSTGLIDTEQKEFNQSYVDKHSPNSLPISTGLSEIQRSSDGRVRISSAKSVGIVKEVHIPVPQRISYDQEVFDETFSVDVLRDSEITRPSDSCSIAGRVDSYKRAHDREYVVQHPEWVYATDTGHILEGALGGQEYEPDHLQTHEYKTPPHVTLEVDKTTHEKYYQGSAQMFITPDGGIVIQDAYGSCIRMTGGNIYFDCPGDIIQLPGRDHAVLAGRGVSIQGRKDVELVSNSGNARIAADNQVEIMGGASGKGGVLLENKSSGIPQPKDGSETQTNGIVVKSPSYISVDSPKIGVVAEDTSFKGNLSVEKMITSPELHTLNLQASDGAFAGVSLWAVNGGSILRKEIDGPSVTPVDTVESSVGDNGFKAPEFNFSFNSSNEYGLLTSELDYGFEMIEPMWQTKERNRLNEDPGDQWELLQNASTDPTYKYPYPGYDLWNSDVLKQVQPYTKSEFWSDAEDPTEDPFKKVPLTSLRVNKSQ